MENYNKVKASILRGVSHKIKMRGIKISVITIIACILIGILIYYVFFVKQEPINVEEFKDVRIERNLETINEVDTRQLPYNTLKFTSKHNMFYSMNESSTNFYVENNDNDNSAILYFYISESYAQKFKSKNQSKEMLKVYDKSLSKLNEEERQKLNQEEIDRQREEISEENKSVPHSILLTPYICKTNNGKINEITKVYYLVYNYDNFNQEKFEKEKQDAVLLWEKE